MGPENAKRDTPQFLILIKGFTLQQEEKGMKTRKSYEILQIPQRRNRISRSVMERIASSSKGVIKS